MNPCGVLRGQGERDAATEGMPDKVAPAAEQADKFIGIFLRIVRTSGVG